MKDLIPVFMIILFIVCIIAGCSVIVSDPITGLDEVIGDVDALTFSTIKGSNRSSDSVVYDLNLVAYGSNNSVITWTSSRPSIISGTGKVKRPAYDAGDALVTLYATIRTANASRVKTFIITVLKRTSPHVIYVKHNATGSNNGSSWTNAYRSLQAAADHTDDPTEIWVAAGTYYPTFQYEATDDRAKAFQFKSGFEVYGGFIGNESDRSERRPARYKTILSGDIGIPDMAADNSYSIVYLPVTSPAFDPVTFDGLVFTGGNGDSTTYYNGGAINNAAFELIIKDCVFTANNVINNGGAISTTRTLTLTRCTFTGNNGEHGGAVINNGAADSVIDRCTFTGNTVTAGEGGAVYTNRPMHIMDSTFRENRSTYSAGGVYINARDTLIERCVFVDNSANVDGGAVYNYSCSLKVIDCLFKGNIAFRDGGGIMNAGSTAYIPFIINSIFYNNRARTNGGAICNKSSIYNCTIVDNEAYRGGGVYYNTDVTIANSILWNNFSEYTYGQSENQIFNPGAMVIHSVVMDGYDATGDLNTVYTSAPSFVSRTDFHLTADNPDIILEGGIDYRDATDDFSLIANDEGYKYDKDGKRRTGNGKTGWSLGAYEYD